MDADKRRFQIDEITERVIGAAYAVANTLGNGFLEKVYENALAHELKKQGLSIEQQPSIEVRYDGVIVGLYVADLIVEESVIVELKAVKELDRIHSAQCLNYLNATNLTTCLLLNFGSPRVDVKRIVHNFIRVFSLPPIILSAFICVYRRFLKHYD